jgi:hypothetical protein
MTGRKRERGNSNSEKDDSFHYETPEREVRYGGTKEFTPETGHCGRIASQVRAKAAFARVRIKAESFQDASRNRKLVAPARGG